ncbi:MAG: helix-hairpin-helix domain-containing protein [Pyrinomonadaceae bacterium]
MKRHGRLRLPIPMLVLFCACVCAGTSCVRLPRRASLPFQNGAAPAATVGRTVARININTAPVEELEKLPGIGKALSARIVAHRERYGRFRRAEHLLMVRGISDRRFREMREMVSVE